MELLVVCFTTLFFNEGLVMSPEQIEILSRALHAALPPAHSPSAQAVRDWHTVAIATATAIATVTPSFSASQFIDNSGY